MRTCKAENADLKASKLALKNYLRKFTQKAK